MVSPWHAMRASSSPAVLPRSSSLPNGDRLRSCAQAELLRRAASSQAELAAANPDLICSVHRGMLEGYVDTLGGATGAD